MDKRELATKKFQAIKRALAAALRIAQPKLESGMSIRDLKKYEAQYNELLVKSEIILKKK